MILSQLKFLMSNPKLATFNTEDGKLVKLEFKSSGLIKYKQRASPRSEVPSEKNLESDIKTKIKSANFGDAKSDAFKWIQSIYSPRIVTKIKSSAIAHLLAYFLKERIPREYYRERKTILYWLQKHLKEAREVFAKNKITLILDNEASITVHPPSIIVEKQPQEKLEFPQKSQNFTDFNAHVNLAHPEQPQYNLMTRRDVSNGPPQKTESFDTLTFQRTNDQVKEEHEVPDVLQYKQQILPSPQFSSDPIIPDFNEYDYGKESTEQDTFNDLSAATGSNNQQDEKDTDISESDEQDEKVADISESDNQDNEIQNKIFSKFFTEESLSQSDLNEIESIIESDVERSF